MYFCDPLPEGMSEQKGLFLTFVSDMARSMGVTAEALSVAELWENRPPSAADGFPMSEYLTAEVRHF